MSQPTIETTHRAHVYFDWASDEIGFGQLEFWLAEDGKFHVTNEFMSRESVRKILVAMANHVADTCVLDDDPES